MSDEIRRIEASKRRIRRQLTAKTAGSEAFSDKIRLVEEMAEQKIPKQSKSSKRSDLETKDSVLLTAIKHTVRKEPRGQQVVRSSDDEKRLDAEIDKLQQNSDQASSAFVELFPEGVPAADEFYDRISDLQLRLGWGESAHRVTGLFLSVAAEKLPAGRDEDLLRGLPKVRNPIFFQYLDSLTIVLSRKELRPEFAAEWFPSLLHRIGNDLAVGGFWSAVRTFCDNHPTTALRTLELLVSGDGHDEIAVGAYILGSLRCLEFDNAGAANLRRVEQQIADATTMAARAIYHRSWVSSAWCGKLGLNDLRQLTERMLRGSPDERDELFGIVCRSLLSPSLPTDASQFGWEWLWEHVSSELAPTAKYNVVDFAGRVVPDKRADAAKLILRIQPILPEHKGIWKELEHFLVRVLDSDVVLFNETLKNLARRNGQNFLSVLREPRQFEWLLSEMQRKNVGPVIAELLLNDNSDCRSLALFLFDNLDVSLPAESFESATQNQIAIVLYELQRSIVHGAAIARLCIFLIPFVERSDSWLKEEFCSELVLQLKNFPGVCKDEFSAKASEFPILRRAIDETEAYFAALKKVWNTSVNRIEASGFRRAAQLHARRFSDEVSRGADAYSIFTKLLKKVRLLYGQQWRTFYDGVLGESSGLKQISTSMEFPRMEFIDPEAMQLRRLRASFRIRELSLASTK
jgi:hypothetical protein